MRIINQAFFWITILALSGIMCMAFKMDVHSKVVCFGDSITFGSQVNGHSWVSILGEAHKEEAEFINAGRSGRRTADREELLPVLKKYPDAACYLIFLGVNDLKDGTDSMVDLCVENMKWMVERVRSTNPRAKIVILAPSGINLRTMNGINRQKKYNENTKACLARLEKRYGELAKAEGAGFISLLRVVSPQNYADGLHPDLKGQQQIASAVWKDLKKLIQVP